MLLYYFCIYKFNLQAQSRLYVHIESNIMPSKNGLHRRQIIPSIYQLHGLKSSLEMFFHLHSLALQFSLPCLPNLHFGTTKYDANPFLQYQGSNCWLKAFFFLSFTVSSITTVSFMACSVRPNNHHTQLKYHVLLHTAQTPHRKVLRQADTLHAMEGYQFTGHIPPSIASKTVKQYCHFFWENPIHIIPSDSIFYLPSHKVNSSSYTSQNISFSSASLSLFHFFFFLSQVHETFFSSTVFLSSKVKISHKHCQLQAKIQDISECCPQPLAYFQVTLSAGS